MKNFLNYLLDWIYKKKCYFCSGSKESVKMCSCCYNDMEHLQPLENREIDGIKVYCAGVYESNIQKLIRGLKYHNQRDLAHYLAKFMHEYWCEIASSEDEFVIIPVPLFKKREKSRKYNHMALVADEFAKLSGYKVDLELVRRVKDTKPQYKLNRAQRMQNLDKAFSINPKVVKSSKILLIDDICTTGSTFESIIQELKKNNINDIVCLAAASPIG